MTKNADHLDKLWVDRVTSDIPHDGCFSAGHALGRKINASQQKTSCHAKFVGLVSKNDDRARHGAEFSVDLPGHTVGRRPRKEPKLARTTDIDVEWIVDGPLAKTVNNHCLVVRHGRDRERWIVLEILEKGMIVSETIRGMLDVIEMSSPLAEKILGKLRGNILAVDVNVLGRFVD